MQLPSQPLSRIDLPAELWTCIFDLAADEAVIFDHALPTVTSESTWFKKIYGDWALRTPQESLNSIQRRSYATKKAIIATCKAWRRYGSEFLFRCLFFDDPMKLKLLSVILESEPSLGWWTKRMHITRYYAGRGTTLEEMQNALVSIIRRLPNLEIFVVDWPMGAAFGPIADALSTYCSKSLRTVHWNVPSEAMSKVIWALDSLPNLHSVHVDFEHPVEDGVPLGAAQDVTLSLPNLRQLSLHGLSQQFLEQATGWSIPSLASLSFDFGNYRNDLPDFKEFLLHHGAELTFLDINCIPPLDVATILDICPLLETFNFNIDWRLPTHTGDEDADPPTLYSASPIVRRPHAHITRIGCHGLLYAFGVGFAAAYALGDPLRTHLIRRTNDCNFAALTKENFPKLQSIRLLSRTLLHDLNKADGPDETCDERWKRWWVQTDKEGIRLEDCTGGLLGNLPMDEVEEETEEEETDEEDRDEEEAEKKGGLLSELMQVVEECKKRRAEWDADQERFHVAKNVWMSQVGRLARDGTGKDDEDDEDEDVEYEEGDEEYGSEEYEEDDDDDGKEDGEQQASTGVSSFELQKLLADCRKLTSLRDNARSSSYNPGR